MLSDGNGFSFRDWFFSPQFSSCGSGRFVAWFRIPTMLMKSRPGCRNAGCVTGCSGPSDRLRPPCPRHLAQPELHVWGGGGMTIWLQVTFSCCAQTPCADPPCSALKAQLLRLSWGSRSADSDLPMGGEAVGGWGQLKVLLINLPVSFWQICEQPKKRHLWIILGNKSIPSLLYEYMLRVLKSSDICRSASWQSCCEKPIW